MRFGIFCLIMFYFRAVPFIFFCISTIFNAANASINSEEDFRWNLVKLSVQVGLSGVIYKNSNDWYGTQKHAKNIMEEIPHMIADCALKRGVFANVKDGIVRFENSNVSSYTNANKNAYLLYNYVYNQMYAGNSSVVNVGAMFSDNGKYDLSKAISDIKTYVKDLKLQGFDKYKDIKTIPHIKIEKRYTEGEAQFSIDQDIYTDPNYKRFQYATKRKVKVAYLKDKKIVLGYENSFANAGISYFMISDDYLNTKPVFDFVLPKFVAKEITIDAWKNITIDAWKNRDNEYLDFEWIDDVLDGDYGKLDGTVVRKLQQVKIKEDLNLTSPIHINLIIPCDVDGSIVLLGFGFFRDLKRPEITISLRGVNKNGLKPVLNRNCWCMFSGSASLTEICMDNIETKYVKSMGRAFEKTGIKNIVFGCELNAVNDLYGVFNEAYNLESVTFLDIANITKATCFDGMFYDCRNLKRVCLNGINVHNAKRMHYMFFGCKKLNQVICNKMFPKLPKCKKLDIMKGCNSLVDPRVQRAILEGGRPFPKIKCNAPQGQIVSVIK